MKKKIGYYDMKKFLELRVKLSFGLSKYIFKIKFKCID